MFLCIHRQNQAKESGAGNKGKGTYEPVNYNEGRVIMANYCIVVE